MTLGDALDFGDLTEARRLSGSVCSSSTRRGFSWWINVIHQIK